MINQEQEVTLNGKTTYEEYVKYAKKIGAAQLTELEWRRNQEESLNKKREELLRKERSLIEATTGISVRAVKSIDQLIEDQAIKNVQYTRSQKALTEAFKNATKGFFGVGDSIKVTQTPTLAISSMLKKNTERLISFDELPPIFSDVKNLVGGLSNFFTGKVIDPLINKAVSKIKDRKEEQKNIEFLLKNDPRFKESTKTEVKSYLKERKESFFELKTLEERRAKLSSLGGVDPALEAEIRSIRDLLSGKFESEESDSREPREQKTTDENKTKRESNAGQSFAEFDYSWFKTLDNGNVAIVTNLVKIDNRLASIESKITECFSIKKEFVESQSPIVVESNRETETKVLGTKLSNDIMFGTEKRLEDVFNVLKHMDKNNNKFYSALIENTSKFFETTERRWDRLDAEAEERFEEESRIPRDIFPQNINQRQQQEQINQEPDDAKFGILSGLISSVSGVLGSVIGAFSSIAGLAKFIPSLDTIIGAVSTLGTVFKFLMRFNPIVLGVSAIMLAKSFVEQIEKLALFTESGTPTAVGAVIDKANKLLGGSGIKPVSEMGKTEQLEYDTEVEWFRSGDTKRKEYLDKISRGQEFSQEEANILKKNLNIDVPKRNISPQSGDESKTETPVQPVPKRSKEEVIKSIAQLKTLKEKNGGTFYDQAIAIQEKELDNLSKESDLIKSETKIEPVKRADVPSNTESKFETKVQPIDRGVGIQIEAAEKNLIEAQRQQTQEVPTQPQIIVAPSASSTVNNTTAVGIRSKPRNADQTFERMTGVRYANGW